MSMPCTHGPSQAELDRRRKQIRRGLKRANLAAVITLALVIGLAVGAVLQAARATRNANQAALYWRTAENELERERQTEAKALLERARAQRRSGEAGQRLESLAAIARAAAIRPTAALRDEAIAALALPDFEFVPVWTNRSPAFCLFSPTSERFAVGATNGAISLMNVRTGRETDRLPGVGASVNQFWFSQNERWLAAHYANGASQLWDIATKTPVRRWPTGCQFLQFCPDNERLLVLEDSGRLCCQALVSGLELWSSQTGPRVTMLSVDALGRYFALFVPGSPIVQVRSLQTGRLVREVKSNLRPATLAWSPDDREFVIGRQNGRVEVWDSASWTQSRSWKAHDDAVVEVRFDPRGRWLATASWDSSIRFWGLPDFRPVVCAMGYNGHFVAQFSPDGTRFACVYGSKVVGFLEASASPVVRRLFVPPGEARGAWSVDLSPDEKLVAAGYDDGIRLLDLETGRQLGFEPLPDCRSVLFTRDGQALVSSGDSGVFHWCLGHSGPDGSGSVVLRQRVPIQKGSGFVYADLSADARWMAVAVPGDDCVHICQLEPSTNDFRLGPHKNLQHVAISPNGRWVASGTWYGQGVKIWEVGSRRLLADLPVEDSATVTFSPDSRLLVTGARDYRVWGCDSWRELYCSAETGALAPPAAFSSEGQLLAILRTPNTIELRAASTGRVLAGLQAPGSPQISGLRFSADSRQLLALEWTRSIQVWDLEGIHKELARLGLDWENGLPGTSDLALQPTASGVTASPHFGTRPESASAEAQTGMWFYAITLAALALGIGVGLYTMGYHQRLIHSYAEIESFAAERSRSLEAAHTELLHSQKMRALGTLAAGIAHDFNNLLSVIRMGNQMLRRRDSSAAEQAQSSLAVERAVEQGRQIVRSMLGYTREQTQESERYSVSDVVNEAGLLLNQQYLCGITVTLELKRDLPLVEGRRGRLQQILLNLIVNAAEAMGGQGRLCIAARATNSAEAAFVLPAAPAPHYVELLIADNGPGIDSSTRDRVFEAFFSTKPRGTSSGTGLGLFLVHSLAEQEGIGIRLESEPGRGTCFTLWIPAIQLEVAPGEVERLAAGYAQATYV